MRPEISDVRRIVSLSNALTSAEHIRLTATSEHQRRWKSDPQGRRRRGAIQGAANRRSKHAMKALIEAVQSPDAPAVVRRHFAVNGPTYYEAAACASRLEDLSQESD